VGDAEREFDTKLIEQIAGGDESAFQALYKRFSPRLYGLAVRMMADAGEAEEVLQEGFIYIWRKASSYDPSRISPFAWSVMIVRHKAIDRLRARNRMKLIYEKVIAEKDSLSSADEYSAQKPAIRERGVLVRKALEELPDEQRLALELTFFGGLTQAEIAEHLRAPLGTIKARIRRGLLRLRDGLRGSL
jgi:RNA polymerase sigma-70 factor (ECF subfamily)